MLIQITPCRSDGTSLDETNYTNDPDTLLNKPFYFKVISRLTNTKYSENIHKKANTSVKLSISVCEIAQNQNAKGFKVKFKIFGDNSYIETPMVANSVKMDFKYSHVVTYAKLTKVRYMLCLNY